MDDFIARRDLLDKDAIDFLTRRSDVKGLRRLAGHLGLVLLAALALEFGRGTPWSAPATLGYGVLITFLFTAEHESIHRTAFRSRWLNDAVAWGAGLVLLLPPGYFRHFHFAHHRHTQVPEGDPELATPKPAALGRYLLWVSGLPYWHERVLTTVRHARGRVAEGYIPSAERPRVAAEARAFLALYALIAGAAVALESSAPVTYWLAPVLVGQPFLRLFLLAEHAGCPLVEDMLANSRTTGTNGLVRFIAWNMPYHAEHHAFPGVPFHALPALSGRVGREARVVAPGYLDFHRRLLATLTARPRSSGRRPRGV